MYSNRKGYRHAFVRAAVNNMFQGEVCGYDIYLQIC